MLEVPWQNHNAIAVDQIEHCRYVVSSSCSAPLDWYGMRTSHEAADLKLLGCSIGKLRLRQK